MLTETDGGPRDPSATTRIVQEADAAPDIEVRGVEITAQRKRDFHTGETVHVSVRQFLHGSVVVGGSFFIVRVRLTESPKRQTNKKRC